MKQVYFVLFAACCGLVVYSPDAIFGIAPMALYFFAQFDYRRNVS